jgi:predicted nucleic acid-binding protein
LTVFLDACAIIYRVDAVEPYLSRLKAAISRLHAGSTPPGLAISRLSLLECRVQPLRKNDTPLLAAYEEFFSAPELRIVELDPEVVDRATIVRSRTNLSTPDALQAACALHLGDGVRFVTSDGKFKRVPGLEVELI